MEILVKDGIRYLLYQYKNEAEIENIIREHIEFIFGNNSLFFEKNKIKSEAGMGSIPDGFVVLPFEQKWYVVEIELSSHSLYEHIVPQISKFRNAIKNPFTKNNIINAFEEEIENNPGLNYKYKNIGIKKERYKLITEVINEIPEIVIIIDKKTKELEDVCDSLPFTSKVVEFKTFQRENSNVLVHMFNNIVSYTEENKGKEIVIAKPVFPINKTPYRKNKALDDILEVANLVLNQNKNYNEAVKIIAKKRNICESTVRAGCTRTIKLNTERFKDLLIGDKNKLFVFLVNRFPSEKEIIEEKIMPKNL